MWSMMKNLVGEGDNGWGRFLPFIVLMIMYGLSTIFKNKPKKPPQKKRPDSEPMPSTPKRRLPSYARNRTQTTTPPQSQPQSQPRHRPKAPTQPKSQPVPSQTRRPVPVAQPAPQPRPVAKAPRPVQERPTAKPVAKKPVAQTTRHIQQEKKPRKTEHHAKPVRTSTSAKTAVQAMHSRRRHVSQPQQVETRPLTATERLVRNTSRKGPLAQAILFGEILGTPMALRSMGSHNYSSLGASGTGQ